MKGVLEVDLLVDGIPIKGTYYRPIATHAPGLVLIHGTGRTRADWQIFARSAMEQGFATLAIDLRGHGDSGGQPHHPDTTHDVGAAVDFLQAQAEVDAATILLVGANDGAWWVLDYASIHPDIRAVALITPGIRYDPSLLDKVMTQYGPRPLFIAVSQSPQVGDENALKTARYLAGIAQGPHELVILDDNAWGIGLLMESNGLAARLLDWLQQQAQAAGAQ